MNIVLEVKVKELEELNVTLKETKKELSDNIDSLESELNALIVVKNGFENQVKALNANTLIVQDSNKKLLSQLNEANEKFIKLTIGAEKVDKMLSMGKVHGDKRGLGFNESGPSVSYTKTNFVKAIVPTVSSSLDETSPMKPRFLPTCHHCGALGHIRPKCKSLRSESLVTKYHGFKTHVTSPNGFKNEKSSVCAAANKSSFLAKFGSPKSKMFIPTCHHCGILGHIRPRCSQLREFGKKSMSHQMKRNDNSLQSQVHNLLSEVVKISRLVSLPHKVSKEKQVWIKKEDHVLPHVGD